AVGVEVVHNVLEVKNTVADVGGGEVDRTGASVSQQSTRLSGDEVEMVWQAGRRHGGEIIVHEDESRSVVPIVWDVMIVVIPECQVGALRSEEAIHLPVVVRLMRGPSCGRGPCTFCLLRDGDRIPT